MGSRTRLWITIIGCVIVALFIINLLRVNPPAASPQASPTPFVEPHIVGPIVMGRIIIEPGTFLQYRLNFNYKATVRGQFRIASGGPWVACLILTEQNFEKWKKGEEFVAATSTGTVPRGLITRKLDSGVYYVVFDNRASKQKAAEVDAELHVE